MGNNNSRQEKKPQSDQKDDSKDEQKNNNLNQIVVHVIRARELPGKDASGSSDPYCIVTIGEKKFRTNVRPRDKNPIWNQSFTEEGLNLTQKIKEISLDVYDRDKISSDDFIGGCKLAVEDFSTLQIAPQWHPLFDKKKKVGEIQLQIQFAEDVRELSVRNFTHILQFTLKNGKDFRNMEWIGKNDPYVRVEWGSQRWKTKTVNGTNNPTWNETIHIFIDKTQHADYVLRCTILDQDFAKGDFVGSGIIQAKDIFADGKYDKPVFLTKTLFNSDKKLGLISDNSQSDQHCGEIYIDAVLFERKKIETDYYSWLMSKFDTDKDEYLDREEFRKIFAILKSNDSNLSSDEFFAKFDKNSDEKLDKNEVISMLCDSKFQDSDLAPQLMLNFLRKDNASLSSMVMAGFSSPEEVSNRKVITLKDRKTGLLVQENIPSYIWISMRLLYDNKTGRAITHNVKNILKKMSKEKGEEYDKPQSKKEIKPFIDLHGLDVSILTKKEDEFENFNDFFARAIDLNVRPMSKNDDDIASPADCRMMLFSSIFDVGIWVKGDKFTVSELLGARAEVAPKFEGGAFCIGRLAPQDYHRFHWPVSGKVTKITPIDGALYTVNPVAVNKPLNVFTENKRCVIELESKQFGNVIFVAVAATMVGSYVLFKEDTIKLEEGMEVKKGDVAGEFRFGGSTVLVLFETKKVKWENDILTNSTKNILETLIQCRETIGHKA